VKEQLDKDPCGSWVKACIEAHENSHITQILHSDPDICKGVKDGWEIVVFGPGADKLIVTGVDLALEIAALSEQIWCLLDALKKAPKKCEDYIKAELTTVLELQDKKSKQFGEIVEKLSPPRPVPAPKQDQPSTGDWYQGPPRNGIEEWWEYERQRQPIWGGPGRPRLEPYPIKLPQPRVPRPAPVR
jgi:hypothetical protein